MASSLTPDENTLLIRLVEHAAKRLSVRYCAELPPGFFDQIPEENVLAVDQAFEAWRAIHQPLKTGESDWVWMLYLAARLRGDV